MNKFPDELKIMRKSIKAVCMWVVRYGFVNGVVICDLLLNQIHDTPRRLNSKFNPLHSASQH